ncbi:hypothetical protein FQA47_016470 [Oryzias melastigma]|uniref:Uncharacterized protein n=1 Tax=Oryzias melastigma TaxID=30732 RepID=A0A834F8Q3_ORYME|nr:hypothetical protein FQA47_016470 [Oryzias melastigma]
MCAEWRCRDHELPFLLPRWLLRVRGFGMVSGVPAASQHHHSASLRAPAPRVDRSGLRLRSFSQERHEIMACMWGGQRDEWSEDVTSSGSEVAREQILDEAHRKKLNREK